MLGPVDDHLAKLNELKDLGVDQFSAYVMHDDIEGTLDAYGKSIISEMGE